MVVFVRVDIQMRLEPSLLIPCHGDAHARNLLPSTEGWICTDFEDVYLMPAYWDLGALFGGIQPANFSIHIESSRQGHRPKRFWICYYRTYTNVYIR